MIRLGKYKHYKGKEYVVLGVARHSETLEELVVYRALYPSQGEAGGEGELWVRPAEMFLEEVEKLEHNYKGPRFKFLNE